MPLQVNEKLLKKASADIYQPADMEAWFNLKDKCRREFNKFARKPDENTLKSAQDCIDMFCKLLVTRS